MVGMTIHNQVNESDKPIRISFRRNDQLSREVIWSVFETFSQSNSRFNALDTLVVNVHSVKMPVEFGGIKTMGRPVSVLAHIKKHHTSSGHRELLSARVKSNDCENRTRFKL